MIVRSYLTTSRFLLHWPMIGGFRLINLSGVNFRLDLVVLLQTAGAEGILDKKTTRHFHKPATGVLLCFVPLYASFLVIGARTLHRLRLRQLTQKRLDLQSFCTDSVTLRHTNVFKWQTHATSVLQFRCAGLISQQASDQIGYGSTTQNMKPDAHLVKHCKADSTRSFNSAALR